MSGCSLAVLTLTLLYLTLSYLTLPYLTLPYLTVFYLTLPYLPVKTFYSLALRPPVDPMCISELTTRLQNPQV